MSFDYPNHYEMKKNRLMVLQQHGYKCQICGGEATIVHHADDSKDNHDPENLVPLCAKCHTNLHAKTSKITWDTEIINIALMHRGMDKKELAQKIGITYTAFVTILRRGTTKNSTMKKIAEALEYPIEAFILEVPDGMSEITVKPKTDAARISDAVSKRAIELEKSDKKRQRLYKYWMTAELRERFGVNSYCSIKESDAETAIFLVSTWRPGKGFKEAQAG
jgi:DNA-binding Xre family transcriptional regulator